MFGYSINGSLTAINGELSWGVGGDKQIVKW